MIRGLFRRMIQAELREMEESMAKKLAGIVSRNNEKIEADLLNLGLLEKADDGTLNRHSCRS